eukprot:2395356-Pleurochrysis_carterae.AAC.1
MSAWRVSTAPGRPRPARGSQSLGRWAAGSSCRSIPPCPSRRCPAASGWRPSTRRLLAPPRRPSAPVASSPPAPPPLPPPDTAARAASTATLATRSTSRARGRSTSITSRTMAPTSSLGAPRR